MELPFRPTNQPSRSGDQPLPDGVLFMLFGVALALFIVFFGAF